MQTALYISLWAYLFCMPLSEPGEFFGWLRALIYKATRGRYVRWLYKPLIGCPKCHAGWVAVGYQTLHGGLGWHSIPFILIAIAGAYFLQTWHQIVEKYLHK